MTEQTGTIVTVIVALLTLCLSASCCGVGGLIATGEVEWYSDGAGPRAGQIEPTYGYIGICLGLLIWVIPVLLAVFVARKAKNAA